MSKKLLISTVLLLTIVFSFNICFAANEMQDLTNGVRNVVDGAQNTLENVGQGISNTSKEITGDIENKANQMSNDVMNTMDDNNNNNGETAKDTNNTVGYTATRTATSTDDTFMGMNSTAWTWLILGIVAVAIVGLVWYYTAQLNSSRYNDRN